MGEALAPHLLKLEITERAVVDDSHEAVRVVVAEGVETGQQMAFLRRQRCDALQGYLLARPGRIAELYRYVREAPAAFSAMAPAIVRTA
ncbi:MAG: EAL domain-containing protein [Burkholderiaceae bacterium]|nr:EAL domain-containing protein [Burkholderiaceae bacterium]